MKLCDRCPGTGNCLLNYLGKTCADWRKKNAPDVVITNADRIRAMSDEELADAIQCPAFFDEHTAQKCGQYSSCIPCALDWLQQPVEEETP